MVQDVFSKADVLSTSGSYGAPNFRQSKGSFPLYGMGQPSLDGFKQVLQRLQGQGHQVSAWKSLCWASIKRKRCANNAADKVFVCAEIKPVIDSAKCVLHLRCWLNWCFKWNSVEFEQMSLNNRDDYWLVSSWVLFGLIYMRLLSKGGDFLLFAWGARCVPAFGGRLSSLYAPEEGETFMRTCMISDVTFARRL